jgi:site-specific DNA recombinase
LVREAAERVLTGYGLMTIARDWNRRGVPGATEQPWTAKTLRKVLLSARIAGLREHGVDRSGKVLGALSPAVWEGAIDRRTWDHVRSILLNPERLTTVGTPTRYLLTGLIFCGVCGGRSKHAGATPARGATSVPAIARVISSPSSPSPSTTW